MENEEWAQWRGEVSQTLQDISRRLDEMGERFEKALEKHAERDDKSFTEGFTRIGALERSQSSFSGKMVLLGTVAALLLGAAAQAALNAILR